MWKYSRVERDDRVMVKGGMVIIVIGRICRICRICRVCRVAKGIQVETVELNVEI